MPSVIMSSGAQVVNGVPAMMQFKSLHSTILSVRAAPVEVDKRKIDLKLMN